jgi:HEAT repeat protein
VEKLRTSQGAAYTDALASAIPNLTGPARNKARDALAERLARMSAATLRDKLREKNSETRRAAALACAMKKEKDLIPRLIDLLQDSEPRVMRAAHVALKQLTDQDFGPGPNASRQDQAQAAALWKTWWEKNRG